MVTPLDAEIFDLVDRSFPAIRAVAIVPLVSAEADGAEIREIIDGSGCSPERDTP